MPIVHFTAEQLLHATWWGYRHLGMNPVRYRQPWLRRSGAGHQIDPVVFALDNQRQLGGTWSVEPLSRSAFAAELRRLEQDFLPRVGDRNGTPLDLGAPDDSLHMRSVDAGDAIEIVVTRSDLLICCSGRWAALVMLLPARYPSPENYTTAADVRSVKELDAWKILAGHAANLHAFLAAVARPDPSGQRSRG